MADFIEAHKVVAKNEGGYSNRKEDSGGETYAGISRKWHPNWPGWPIVDSHKPLKHGQHINDQALSPLIKQFYKANFWDKIKGDLINSQRAATFIYDWLVTSYDDSIKAAQKVAGVTPDGKFGNKTLEAVNAMKEDDFMEAMKNERRFFYIALAEKNPKEKANLQGWLNRVSSFA